jgi:coenzyme F420-reducing hydrogenase delta subunit
VFACGEIVTAPGSVVEACASGRRAATAVDLYLRGQPIEIDDTLPPEIGRIDEETAEKVKHVPRSEVRAEPPDARRTDFRPVDHTYDEPTVLREARRCMSCGGGAEVLVDKCTACLTCLRVCPFDIPEVTDVARIDSALCQACGMCIADCPGNAIIARSWSVEELRDETRAKLAADGRDVVAYICGHHAPAAAWSGEEDGTAGVAELYLPSMSRLSAATVLHALRAGARGVIVVACHSGADRYPNATERVTKRLEQVRELLGEIGLATEKVQLVTEADRGRAAMREAIQKAAEQIRRT